MIVLICNIITFLCFCFMFYLYKKQQKQYKKQQEQNSRLIQELNGRIFRLSNDKRVETDTILIRYSKVTPFTGTEQQHLSFDYVKESMVTELANELIEKNIFQIETHRHYYLGKITFVKPE